LRTGSVNSTADPRRIVAIGGVDPDSNLIEQFLVELGRARREQPKVCWVPTASGDYEHGTELQEVVASRPDARAYGVGLDDAGDVVETELAARAL
jgi:hypothetical protein